MSSTSLASSSLGSVSSVFGVGMSVLSLSTRSQCSEDAADDDDLDLSLFEGSSTGGTTRTTTTVFEDEEEEYVSFHHSLLEKKRNSITKILDGGVEKTPSRKKAPAPQAPKNIGHRRRPKLGDINWRSEEIFADDDVQMIVEVSSRDFMMAPKPSVESENEDEFGFVQVEKLEINLTQEIVKEVIVEVEEKSRHVEDLDLDLDMFSMTKDPDDRPQHVSGGKGLLITLTLLISAN